MSIELKVVLAFQILGELPLIGNIPDFDATIAHLRSMGFDDKQVILGQGTRYTPQNVFITQTRYHEDQHPNSLVSSLIAELIEFWEQRRIKGVFFVRASTSDNSWSVTGNN